MVTVKGEAAGDPLPDGLFLPPTKNFMEAIDNLNRVPRRRFSKPSPRTDTGRISPDLVIDNLQVHEEEDARSFASTVLGIIMFIALALLAAVFSALLAAIFLGSTGSGSEQAPLGEPMQIEPPCLDAFSAFKPIMLALPPPPPCRFSWTRFRCSDAVQCAITVHWLPLPHPGCQRRSAS